MKKCCKETYKWVLEEVIFTVEQRGCYSIRELISALKYAVTLLEKPKDKNNDLHS